MNPSIMSPGTGTNEPMASFQFNKPNELLKTGLLTCGIISSLLYVSFDIFAAMQYSGYSYNAQTISELFGLNAPTRPIELLFGPVYTVLIVAFAVGAWLSSDGKQKLIMAATLLLLYAIVEQVNLMYFPLHMRGAEHTLRDTMHVILTGITALLMVLSIAVCAKCFGKKFQLFSIITIMILIAFAGIAALDAGKLDTNEPTPFMGIAERINVYAFMLWMMVLAIMILRQQKRFTILNFPVHKIDKN